MEKHPAAIRPHKAIAMQSGRQGMTELNWLSSSPRKAKVNAAMKWGWTALMIASRGGHLHVVKALLANGPPMQMPRRSWAKPLLGKAALMMASEEGHLDVAQALLANGADVNAARTSSAALMVVTGRGHLDLERALLSKDADVQCQEGLWRYRVDDGCLKRPSCVVRALFSDAKADSGATALMMAAVEGQLELVRALLAPQVIVSDKL
jgi:ankyrin repeat protein